jgi:uncharacterized protein (TIGR02246 family)
MGCQPRAQEAAGLSEEDVAAIKSISPTWAQSWLDCNIEAAVALYAEDAVRIEADEGPALEGREAIRASLDEGFCDILIDFTIDNVRVEGQGDLAYAWDTFVTTAVVGGDTITAEGNWLGVVRRQPDGSWKIEIDAPSLEAPWPSQEAGPLSEEDVAAISSASQAWAEAFKANDDAAMIAFATGDMVLMPPNMPAFQGKTATEEFLAGFTVTDFSVTRLEIDGRGDLAFERSAYVVSAVPEGLTEPTTNPGKYLNIWRKQADGSWLMAINIWNSDLPLPEESAEAGT